MGRVWLVFAPALATELGISRSAPFVADFSLNFTTCGGHSEAIPCGYKARITNGRLSSVPEATPLVLLGLGIVLAGFGHKTLFLHSGLCAWLWCHALLMMCRS